MPDDVLKERGNSLEEEFFRKQNAELVERLRSAQAQDEARSQMAAVSGVADPALADQLLAHNVTPATFAAFSLAPLVAVAWSDRRIEAKEKQAVLQEAASSGLRTGSAEHDLLENWLNEGPPDTLMATWSSYASALSEALGPEQRREFRDTLLTRAEAIANAAGGFAGRGKKSPEEQRVLDAIQAAFAS